MISLLLIKSHINIKQKCSYSACINNKLRKYYFDFLLSDKRIDKYVEKTIIAIETGVETNVFILSQLNIEGKIL